MYKISSAKFLTMTILVILVCVGGYYILNAPDRRSNTQKMNDAINELPNGFNQAARQLEDRTPAEKIGDAAEDAGDDIKKATNQ